MTSFPSDISERDLYIVYIIAVIVICGSAVALTLRVPDEVTGYVSNGLMLPAFRYGLLFALIACGVIFTSDRRPVALATNLIILGSALWIGIENAEPIVLYFEPLAILITSYPVLTPTMGIATGAALLLPLKARKWIVPAVSAICGLAAGLFIILESPADYNVDWFTSAAAVGCMAVVVASIALFDAIKRLCAVTWISIVERIFGSWLIAASLMLGALAVVPESPLGSGSTSTIGTDDIEWIRQPNMPRIFNTENFPPRHQRQVGDIVNAPNGTTFTWNGQEWEEIK